MKKTKLFGLALIATMTSFSACTNDAEEALTQESEIKLTSEITPMSRTTNQNLQSTSIIANRQVGITVTGAKSTHNNKPWTVEANGTLTNTDDKLYWGNGNATFYAYHPYNENWTGNSHSFSVQTDQSTDEGYLNSDLLYGWRANVAKTAEAVTIPFVHSLTKINITVDSDDIDNLNGASVYICGTDIDLTFNPQFAAHVGNIDITDQTTIQDIKAGTATGLANNISYSVSAIIVPQTITADTKFIKVSLNEKDYYYITPQELSFQATEEYTFNLKLKKKEDLIELKSGYTLQDWYDETPSFSSNAGEGDGVTEIYQGTAGTFSTIVGNYGTFAHLKLSGMINNADLSYINTNLTNLRYLDLSDAKLDGSSTFHFGNLRSTNLIYLSLPKNITAVEGDTQPYVKTIIIPATVNTIGGIWGTLNEIHCKATTPPTLAAGCDLTYAIENNCKLYVPTAAKATYEVADVWKDFEIIGE